MELFDGKKIFDFPKPTTLIKKLLDISTKRGDVILDFFAGSSTTAHAVLDLNYREAERTCKYILIQLPEVLNESSEGYKLGFKTISDIGKERIRRVINKIKKEQEQNRQQSLLGQSGDDDKKPLDLGFKVYKLTKSNFKQWEGEMEPQKVAEQLKLHVDHIDKASSEEDILYEILLKTGFELTVQVEPIELVGKKVFSIDDKTMLVCLEKALNREVMDAMVALEPSRVVCLDIGFAGNDQLKTNTVQQMKAKNIEFRTV